MYAFGNVHLSQVRSILFTFSVFCFLFIREIDSRFPQTANVDRPFPSCPSLYFKMKLVITRKVFYLTSFWKWWFFEILKWPVQTFCWVFLLWKKLSKWISFAPFTILTSNSVCLLYIPPVVTLVNFEKNKVPVLEFICKGFLSVCYCISFLFLFFM